MAKALITRTGRAPLSSVATPSVPSGTGSSNAVQNLTGTTVTIYLDTVAAAPHIVDHLGVDKALPQTSAGAYRTLRLKNGYKAYFTTAAPSAWLWERE